MSAIPASIDLAIMFPPSKGLNGACTTIADASRYFRAGLPYPSKWLAVYTIVRGNLERNVATGRGMKARKRIASIIGAKMAQDAAIFGTGACFIDHDGRTRHVPIEDIIIRRQHP
jgi:hypothetical protein